MKKIQKTLLVASISTLLYSSASFPAAFQLYELGTPIIGTAGVGQAAVATDASTSYFNPAGMSQLSNTQFMVGGQALLSYNHFSPNNQTTIVGNNGSNAGALLPGMDLYYVYSYTPKVKFGLSFTAPYGGLLSFNDGWVGRYSIQNMQFFTLDLNPAISYQMNDKISLGGGLVVEYADLVQNVALPYQPNADGQVKVNVNDFKPGFNLGVLFTPQAGTKIGLAYRSPINHDLKGSITFLRITNSPATTSKMTMPQNVILSASQDLTQRFTVLGELGWSNWSTMESSILRVGRLSAVTVLDWKNTYRIGLAGQFKATPAVMLNAGASYDSSPTKTTLRTPNLPMDKQLRLGFGLTYKIMKNTKIGFSYEYLNFGRAPIYNSSYEGVVAGAFPLNYANIVQASINVDC